MKKAKEKPKPEDSALEIVSKSPKIDFDRTWEEVQKEREDER